MTKMDSQKGKWQSDCNNIGQSQLNIQAVLQVFSKPPKPPKPPFPHK